MFGKYSAELLQPLLPELQTPASVRGPDRRAHADPMPNRAYGREAETEAGPPGALSPQGAAAERSINAVKARVTDLMTERILFTEQRIFDQGRRKCGL